MSADRKLRDTLSAVACVGALLCALGLMSSAISVAAGSPPARAVFGAAAQ
jgi:hypothetical protein